jgi:serine protease Do
VLQQFSGAVESMVHRVSPTVVQVVASTYAVENDGNRLTVSRGVDQRVASGVIIASDGYIMTNAHVVQHAYNIRVRLVPAGPQAIGDVLAQSFAATLDATLVGTYADADLALLKIGTASLPALRIAPLGSVHQGQLVFAFGSPNGLQNSVTMGVVSSVARQLDPDDPLLYIQTDAPINPGNSGGPLVSTAGDLLGLNTFISTQSGGSEGMGFAVPGAVVRWVYEQLRNNGHVTRPTIGAGLQTITPPMAAALHLQRTSGVIVSDILADSPAATAGLKLNDIVLTVNGRPMDNVAAWTGLSFLHSPGSSMLFEVLRGDSALSMRVSPVDVEQPSQHLADTVDVMKGRVNQLGILALTLDQRMASMMGSSLRLSSGVVVAARVPTPEAATSDLRPGDLIHEINGRTVYSVDNLRAVLLGLTAGDPVALLVERAGRWFYSAFNMP